MNNLECSSECESGWTMYLEHSLVSLNPCKSNGQFSDFECNYNRKVMKEVYAVEKEEEEDLSMVSDASSGPAHFLEHEDYCTENGNFSASSSSLKNKSSKRQKKIRQKRSSDSLLDDTASSPMSPIYSFSKVQPFKKPSEPTTSPSSFMNSNFTFTNKKVSIDHLLGFSQDFITTTHLKEKSTLGKSFGTLKSSLPGKYLKQNQ
ncbi:hypothetical protein C5167_024570 [Papaver somniferum]|uniref:Uncharacterized protein n=1 Tax=Papaver somniferum TaxID=3469 RepID=A0A4Y7JSY1_PAPSO|nr:hypothetical protein C5167_024570 [Papaver somniferum]